MFNSEILIFHQSSRSPQILNGLVQLPDGNIVWSPMPEGFKSIFILANPLCKGTSCQIVLGQIGFPSSNPDKIQNWLARICYFCDKKFNNRSFLAKLSTCVTRESPKRLILWKTPFCRKFASAQFCSWALVLQNSNNTNRKRDRQCLVFIFVDYLWPILLKISEGDILLI